MKIESFDIGKHVECDMCCRDCTDSTECGGFIFESKAVCPLCGPNILALAKKYNEERYVKVKCPQDVEFRHFVLMQRGGNNTVRIVTHGG